MDSQVLNVSNGWGYRQKHKWEPSFMIVPISLHSTGVSCNVRLLLLCPASFPDVQTCVCWSEKFALILGFRPVTTGLSGCPPDFSSGIASFWNVFPDEAPFRHSLDWHCCYLSSVKRFGLAPYLISGKFSGAGAPLLSFRRLAQPSKEHLSVAGVCRIPPVLPFVLRLRLFRLAGFPVRSDQWPI